MATIVLNQSCTVFSPFCLYWQFFNTLLEAGTAAEPLCNCLQLFFTDTAQHRNTTPSLKHLCPRSGECTRGVKITEKKQGKFQHCLIWCTISHPVNSVNQKSWAKFIATLDMRNRARSSKEALSIFPKSVLTWLYLYPRMLPAHISLPCQNNRAPF